MKTANHVANESAAMPTRVAVQVLVYSADLKPEEISSRLSLSASKTQEKGTKYGERTGTRVDIPRHMWQLSSEAHVRDMDLSIHLDWILSKLFVVRERLQSLRDSTDIECLLIGVVWTSGTSAHVRLSAAQLEKLVALRLELQLEFSDYGDDE